MSDPITVLHLRATAFVGGPEKQILGQARCLPQHGFRALIASFKQGKEGIAFLEEAARQGFETLAVPSVGPLDLSPARRLAGEITRRGVSLVCAHGAKASLMGCLAARLAHVPFIAWSRGWTSETWRVRCYDAVDRMALRRANLVIAVSQAQAELCRKAGIRPERLRVIPNAVEIDHAHTSPDLRKELRLPPACRLILSVGRLSPEKGHHRLAAAAPTIIGETPDVFLAVLGEGPERPRLERFLRELGIQGRFLLPGFRRDASQVMAQATLLALPSLTEGLPNVVLEAFAARLPVVATAVGGVPELVKDGETGWLVQDPARLAEVIRRVLETPQEAQRRARVARDFVVREFSFPRQTTQIVSVYRSVLERYKQERPRTFLPQSLVRSGGGYRDRG